MSIRSVSVVIGLIVSGIAAAQETASTKDDPELVKLRGVLDRSIELFQASPARDPAILMTHKPVLRWTNNERDSTSVGLVVLWIDRGQPVAAMATYSWMGNLYHEFDLLSRDSITVKQDATRIWHPQTGLTFQSIPNAPAVETTAVSRLRQMKLLSEQFSATMTGWRADKSDRAELRRLPRELYRYQPESPDIIDGAVYAFAMGNGDPEAILLIEAVKVNGQSEWQYAFVRQTSGSLEGRHKDSVVWSAPRHGERNDPTANGLSIVSRLNLKIELAR